MPAAQRGASVGTEACVHDTLAAVSGCTDMLACLGPCLSSFLLFAVRSCVSA
jgi:hypothetical protein